MYGQRGRPIDNRRNLKDCVEIEIDGQIKGKFLLVYKRRVVRMYRNGNFYFGSMLPNLQGH